MTRKLHILKSQCAGLLLAGSLRAQPVTFAHDIAPIVYRYCAPCHRPGEAGPFPLLYYEDVRKRARQIADVTKRRFMPPWLPEPGHGDFQDELRLSDAQIARFAAWAAAGAPEGPAAETPPPPKFTGGWQLGPPDLILEASKAVSLPASGTDLYWNFIFTANTGARHWVRAIEIRPGNQRVMHHANLYIDRARSARQQGDGFPGMDPVIERSVFDPDDGRFLYWKPGGIPYAEPDGLSWRLDPGNDLVLNAHMQPDGKTEQVRPAIGLYFTEKPQTRYPMLVQLEHDGALHIPAGNSNFLVSDDFKLPLDVDVLAVYPHAHYLGKVLEGYATLPGGERKWLVRIPDWDSNWQAVYRYREPLFLPKGTVVSMRFAYDNSAANPRNPNHPPKRVVAGNQSTDEMAHLWLQVLPRGGRDLRLEIQEALMRHRLEKYPADFGAHFTLGGIRLARLDPSGAAAELEPAVRIAPQNPEARNLLGSAFRGLGRTADAIDQFRLAVKLRPDFQNARYNLARALIKTRRFDEALELFRQVVDAFPNDAQARNGLGEVLFQQGKFAEARAEFDKALAIDPSLSIAQTNRDRALKSEQK
ncbi:MAG TPA: tetratricopeptide repeat protein [Bryobacteraceae bacterium]|nr:tetratricopeptide repeat protein [Bryobacteraceae bacterium]